MDKLIQYFERALMPFASRLAAQKHLQAIRDGIVLTSPLIIIGSFFLIIASLPIPNYPEFMASIFGDQWRNKLIYPVFVTFDIMGLVASIGIAYRLAEKYKVDALSAASVSLVSFLLVTPLNTMFTPEGATAAVEVGGVIPMALMGSRGLFVAMVFAIISVEIFRYIIQKDIVIKMPEGVPPAVSKSFVALFPAFVVVVVVWLIRLVMENTSFESVHNIISTLLGVPLTMLGSSLIGSIIAVLLIHLLWSCGLHGANLVGAVMSPIWLMLMDQNRVAFQADPNGQLPNVVTAQFFDLWIYIGGSGTTLALVVAMFFWAKSAQLKSLGRLSIGPGVFNINEPVIFGMPIVMNPILIIPFILTPIVLVIVTYFAMETGLVARPSGVSVPWTTPMLFSGYLATGGKISGLVLQAVNFLIAFLIYYPFFRLWDNQKLKEERAAENTQTPPVSV
ncbi:PTS cellobiose transporter subunit IIC [Brevibacillus daliensis]|uniref:PTS cellobiose transporter subunit IIC n=1 Tax=Brevibacillus daliensis TaxID=2892995 RepID=UPI001E31D4AA|nr:PTS cellobiose transporter subunit IIC [Brevibacillus daliensis]